MTRDEMRQHAEQLVADWPPLTEEQRSRLAILLEPVLPAVCPKPTISSRRTPVRQAA